MKKSISIVLVLALCFSLAASVYAAGETNELGITFSATLDKSTLQKSESDQQVVLTVVASSAVETSSISYTASVPSGLTLSKLEGDGESVTDATTSLTTGSFSWSASGGAPISVRTIAKVTVTVPANTEAGTYEIGIFGMQLSRDYGFTIIEDGASAFATLTITDGQSGGEGGGESTDPNPEVPQTVNVGAHYEFVNNGTGFGCITFYVKEEIAVDYVKAAISLGDIEVYGVNGLTAKKADDGEYYEFTAADDVSFDLDPAFNGYALFTVKVPAPKSADASYQVTISDVEIKNDDKTYELNTNSVYVTVDSGYEASAIAATTTVDNNGAAGNVTVDVKVNKPFNSAKIVLSYDAEKLTFVNGTVAAGQNMGDKDQKATISGAGGVITIVDFGAGFTDGNAYTLTFTSAKGGVTEVKVTDAGFSTKEEAEIYDLIDAKAGSAASVTINHKVTVTQDDTTSTDYVTPGGNYTYQIESYNGTVYNYSATATEDNVDVAEERISISANGAVTVTGVNGALAVNVTKTLANYTIQWVDENNVVENKVTEQQYETDLVFDVAAGQAHVGATDGHKYTVLVYLTGDTNKTPITATSNNTEDVYAEKTYTVKGALITGDITVEVTKETVTAAQTTITISGEYGEVKVNGTTAGGESVVVDKNKDVTITLDKAEGYDYVVKTKVGDDVTEIVETEGKYVFAVGTKPVELIVVKTVNTGTLSATKYVQLNGKTMWLVTINGLTNTSNTSGKTYRYNNENFYWSDKYDAYCFLVVTENEVSDITVKGYFADGLSIVDTAAEAINYNGNINLTKDASGNAVIDVNDAQLVWNMYSAVYNGFTDNVTMQKFLEADMDEEVGLSTNDAAEVVKKFTNN